MIKKLESKIIQLIKLGMYFSSKASNKFMLRFKLWLETSEAKKSLYVSCVGKDGKEFLKKIIRQFGVKDFDYLIIVYDDTKFNEDIFSTCRFIIDKGYKWQLIKKHVLAEYGEQYDYIFLWDDDIDIESFSVGKFIEILNRNNLDVAQPALIGKSHYSHIITLQNPKYKIGRRTDFVEIMVPVIKGKQWPVFWSMIEKDYNFWGWGYDFYLMSKCGFKRIGIVDQECVYHTKPVRGRQTDSMNDMKRFIQENSNFRKAKKVQIGSLR